MQDHALVVFIAITIGVCVVNNHTLVYISSGFYVYLWLALQRFIKIYILVCDTKVLTNRVLLVIVVASLGSVRLLSVDLIVHVTVLMVVQRGISILWGSLSII